ncbi:MAG: UDP-glucose/GDP-mannose dehydrogenase family protein [Actinomycetia bacterium]|nr:UDP-glucose/GDP-mannose dehydrogenase family protein [Actinomycetes bacterium]
MTAEPIGILGAGWVGLVTGACLADRGYEVIVRDIVGARVASLEAGEVSIHEPGLAEMIARNRARLRFTVSLAETVAAARMLFVCVGTPTTYSGDTDLTAVWQVVDELAHTGAPSGAVLIMKSTVPVGTGASVRSRLDTHGLAGVGYAANPEFLAEGSAVADFQRPDRIVVGAFREGDEDRVAGLFDRFEAPVVRTDVASAEMIKLASNAFLATRISFVNEIANVCEATGADVVEVAHGMGLDNRLGPHFLRAGIGYGGSCFPKDVSALKQLAGNSGYHFLLLNAVIEVNELQKRRVVSKLQKHLGSLRDKVITLLGLAFKPQTNDMREASSLAVAFRLQAEGAHVRGWDPVALDEARELLPSVELFDDVRQALRGADAAVIVTEWDEIAELPLSEVRELMRRPLIVDGRNLLDPRTVRAAGIAYEGIGRPGANG